MTAPALPPEVEEALSLALSDAPARGTCDELLLRTAIRAALDKRGEVSPAAGAGARALGGDGEPVAWQIVDVKDGPTGYVGVTEDSAWARMEKATGCSRAEWAKERHARPLYEHPASDASARVDEAHRALGKPGRVDDDGCCTGCGRSVQPSPCCPDYPVWPGPCRSCYAYDADADTVDSAARALAKAAIDARADEAVTGIIVPEAEWDALLAALNATKGGPDAR